jgi:hypothetical protein
MSTLRDALTKMSFKGVDSTNQCWRRKLPNGDIDIVTAYVDDVVALVAEDAEVWSELSKHFRIFPPESLRRALSVELEYSRPFLDILQISMSVLQYTQEVIKRYENVQGGLKLKAAKSPNDDFCHPDLARLSEEKGFFAESTVSIRKSALHLARMACPGLMPAIGSIASQFHSVSALSDLLLCKFVSYLKQTRDMKLTGQIQRRAKLQVRCFADADMAGNNDTPRSASRSKSMFALGWISKRRTAPSRSAAESEILSLGRFCRDLLLPAEILRDQMRRRRTRRSLSLKTTRQPSESSRAVCPQHSFS